MELVHCEVLVYSSLYVRIVSFLLEPLTASEIAELIIFQIYFNLNISTNRMTPFSLQA